MPEASPPEGCSTNSNGAPGFKVLGTYSMKVRSRPPTVPTLCVASPIGSAATAVPKSASAAPIVQCGTVVSAMIPGLRFARAKPYHAGRYVHEPYARYLIEAANRECPRLARRTRRLGGGGSGVEPTCRAHCRNDAN